MVSLLEVMALYLILGFVAISAAWACIARGGFIGLQQTNSRLARFFRTRFAVMANADSQTNVSVSEVITAPVTAPVFATAVFVVTMVISFGGKPNLTISCNRLDDHKQSPTHETSSIASLQMVEAQSAEVQIIDADLR
jgi:hypothetical protein